jgi:hypothetical protein
MRRLHLGFNEMIAPVADYGKGFVRRKNTGNAAI